ncbi:MAG: Na+/H+ antiporter subunit B [Candidatus Promineifilaceae bacterium]|nr:Na+/H+ antiporter subunit B [Candidatus Promineifilaceae bacterium]
MYSIVLTTTTRLLMPLLTLFALFLLLRGHNFPGGGFVSGLVLAAAFSLYAIAHNVDSARRLLRVSPRQLIGAGMTLAVVSGFLAPLLTGKPFMTGLWLEQSVPVLGKLGTPLLFDVGVDLLVVGVTLVIVFALAELQEAEVPSS